MTAAALGDRFGRRRMFAAGHGAVRARLGGLRAGARRRRADRRARRAGRGRGARDAARAGARQRRLPAGAARRGARHLLRRDRPGRGQRAAGRRRDRRGARLAVDLLAQRADRARRWSRSCCARIPESRGPRRAARPARPRARQRPACSASSGGSCAATPAGWAQRRGARRARRRRGAARRLRAWELRARAPMLPMRFFRSRAFSAGNAAIFFAVGVAVLRRLLPRPVPADRARLRPARAPACGCCRGR